MPSSATLVRRHDSITLSGSGVPSLRHHVDAGLLFVPFDRNPGGLNAHLRRFGQLRPDSISKDQSNFMGHRSRVSPGLVRPNYASQLLVAYTR